MNHTPNRRHFLALSAAGLALPLAAHAQSDALPNVVKLLAGFPAGGAIDVVARRIGDSLRGNVAETFIVENKAGAGGRIAIQTLTTGPTDGSQWLVTPGSMLVIYPHVYKKLAYDPLTDLAPVAQIAHVPLGLAVGPAVPSSVVDVKGYIQWVKANSQAAVVGSPAAGNITHFLTYLLERSSGVKLQHVPYRGSAPAIQDLLGGQIPAVMNPLTDVLPHLPGGKLRVLAVTARSRSSFLPQVPTMAEQGFADVLGSEWIALFAKAGTSPAQIERMATGLRAALRTAAVRESFGKLALEPLETDSASLGRQIRSELATWREVSRTLGFQMED